MSIPTIIGISAHLRHFTGKHGEDAKGRKYPSDAVAESLGEDVSLKERMFGMWELLSRSLLLSYSWI